MIKNKGCCDLELELEMQVARWKWVVGYEFHYRISENGFVHSIKRGGSTGKLLKQHNHKGYRRVWLSKENISSAHQVHRLVAKAFILNLENKPQVNHKDGNKQNNCITNLEWATRPENDKHSREILGNTNKGKKNGNYGYRHTKLYPSSELRNKLVALGIPRYKHNLAELGEMLPETIIIKGWEYKLIMSRAGNKYHCCYVTIQCLGKIFEGNIKKIGIDTDMSFIEDTEANARAKMLIWLIKQRI